MTWKIIISYFLVDQAFAVTNPYLKKSNDKDKVFHSFGAGPPVGQFGKQPH